MFSVYLNFPGAHINVIRGVSGTCDIAHVLTCKVIVGLLFDHLWLHVMISAVVMSYHIIRVD